MVLPKAVREALGVTEGDQLWVEVEGNRVILRPVSSLVRESLGSLRGTWGEEIRFLPQRGARGLGQGELAFLSRHKRIGLDTVLFIYHLEGTEPYSRFTTKLFTCPFPGGFSAVASSLVLAELLVRPFELGDEGKIQGLRGLPQRLPGLEIHPVDGRVAKEGARLRARYGLRSPDALHLATALVHGATAFLTNDQEFRKAQGCGLEILILDEIFSV
jgi:AbrB family looped-hinge helix DNA binding protein